MAVPLQETVQFNWDFQGQTQGAGTPNALGIGALLPLAIGRNNLLFLDVQANANLADFDGSRSINTDALVPVGDTEQKLNTAYLGGALDTYGLDVGFNLDTFFCGNFP